MPSAEALVFALALGAGLGSGLVAGVFFAFSAFVMRAFARLPAGEGIAAMQSVNVAVLNPVFFTAFLGTAAASLAAVAAAWMRWGAPGSAWLLAGGVLYLLGCFGVTAAFNVPRNEILAAVAPGDPAGERVWADYLSSWTAWNHVRTAASLAAAAAFTMALSA